MRWGGILRAVREPPLRPPFPLTPSHQGRGNFKLGRRPRRWRRARRNRAAWPGISRTLRLLQNLVPNEFSWGHSGRGKDCCDPRLRWVDLLLIAGLVFFVGLLFLFLSLFGFLLTFILLAFVSHSFILRFFDFFFLFPSSGWGTHLVQSSSLPGRGGVTPSLRPPSP